MSTVAVILRELLGLFVDDAMLAALVLAVVAVAAFLATGAHADSRITGAVLVAGSVASLLFSIFKATRKNGS